ncbi:MAG: carbonic anhydrase, partial [Candidatus Limnocylindrales bacterium]
MVAELLAGHARFRKELSDDERSLMARLAAEGQRPAAVFIGCSDSRVIPELLTGAAPGQLFVVRNIANHVPRPSDPDRSVGAAIEFAVGQLGVADIIVCGHDGCGGVKAVLGDGSELDPDADLAGWLDGLRPAVERARAQSLGGDPQTLLARAVEEHVVDCLTTLAARWPDPPDRDRAIRLHGWVYDP